MIFKILEDLESAMAAVKLYGSFNFLEHKKVVPLSQKALSDWRLTLADHHPLLDENECRYRQLEIWTGDRKDSVLVYVQENQELFLACEIAILNVRLNRYQVIVAVDALVDLELLYQFYRELWHQDKLFTAELVLDVDQILL